MARPPLAERLCARSECGERFQPLSQRRQYCSLRCYMVMWRETHPEYRARQAATQRARYAASPDVYRERARLWWRQAPKQKRERRRLWILAHPGYQRDWRRKNREKDLERQRRWRLKNRAKIREYERRYRRAVMLRHMPDDPFVQQIMAALFDHRSAASLARRAQAS